jgi:hypothetical protein
VLDTQGAVLERGRIDHLCPEQFVALVRRWLGCRVVFEACMNWHWLFEILEGAMPRNDIVLASPFNTRIISEAQITTDKVDASISGRSAARRSYCEARMREGHPRELAYATLLPIFGRSHGAKRRLDGVWGPHLPTKPQCYGQAWRHREGRKLAQPWWGRKGPTPFWARALWGTLEG